MLIFFYDPHAELQQGRRARSIDAVHRRRTAASSTSSPTTSASTSAAMPPSPSRSTRTSRTIPSTQAAINLARALERELHAVHRAHRQPGLHHLEVHGLHRRRTPRARGPARLRTDARATPSSTTAPRATARRSRRSPRACARARSTSSSARTHAVGRGHVAAPRDRARRAVLADPLRPGGHRQDEPRAHHRRAPRRPHFDEVSAVTSGVADLRAAIDEARDRLGTVGRSARSCSSTRSTASASRSRTRCCTRSRTGSSCSSARRPRTRSSR